METFSALLTLWAGNSLVTGEFPSQWPVTRRFDVFFYLRLNKRMSKESKHMWFQMPSRSLWHHCNVEYAIFNDSVSWSAPSHNLNQWWFDYRRNVFENILKMSSILFRSQCVNSLWPGDAMWRHRLGSTLDRVMACRLVIPSHHLKQNLSCGIHLSAISKEVFMSLIRNMCSGTALLHDDVIEWKHFPRYWPFSGEFPTQRPVTRSFDVFFDLRPNERFSKHSWSWWLKTQSSPLWRHSNGNLPHIAQAQWVNEPNFCITDLSIERL